LARSDWIGSSPALRPFTPPVSDLVLRNVDTGAFEVYDIASNALVGVPEGGPMLTSIATGAPTWRRGPRRRESRAVA
jgi:hypothetical protein